MKNEIKILIGVLLMTTLIPLTQASLSNNTEQYKVISQLGDEVIFDVDFTPIDIEVTKKWDLFEWLQELFGFTSRTYTINGTEICLSSTIESGGYESSILFEKNGMEEEPLIFEVTALGDNQYFIETCYIANPYEDEYLKFGNNSIEVIRISGAEHLNGTRQYIQDIYEYVNETDDNLYTIPDGDYVRVVFEKNLTDANRIDVVLNSSGGYIEIYEKDGNTLIGKSENVTEGWNYIDINHSGNQDTFDMKSDGDITYNLIIDPPQPPNWDTAMADAPDPVNAGQDIKFTATGDDPDNNEYQLVVCRTDSISPNQPSFGGECDSGKELCSSGSTLDETEADCNYTTTDDDVGNLDAYGFLCDSTGRCNPTSSDTTTTINRVYGWLNVSISAPVDNSGYSTGNTNLTINARVTCESDSSEGVCGTIYAWARYNLTGATPSAFINTTEGDNPFYSLFGNGTNLSSIDISGYSGASKDITSNGTHFWIVDNVADEVYYSFINGTLIDTFDISGESDGAHGITVNDTHFFICDTGTQDIHGYWKNGTYSELIDVNIYCSGLDMNDTNFFILDDLVTNRVYNILKNGTILSYFSSTDCSNADDISVVDDYFVELISQVDDRICLFNIHGTFLRYFDLTGITEEATGLGSDDDYTWAIDDDTDMIYQFEHFAIGNGLPITLSKDGSYYFNWTLNITSATDESYLLDVFFNSSLGSENVTNNETTDRQINLNVGGAPAGDCWGYNAGTQTLYVPDGCTYYIPDGSTGYF